LLTVCRNVERNALRANLVKRADQWRWSSLWQRVYATQVHWLSAWPVALPTQWTVYVNAAQTESELAALRHSVKRGSPYGDEVWHEETAVVLGLQATMRPHVRPGKAKTKASEKKPAPFPCPQGWSLPGFPFTIPSRPSRRQP